MRDFRPFLQIVHVSDLHLVASEYASWPAVRACYRALRKVSSDRAQRFRIGTTPHDPTAIEPFGSFLEAIATGDAIWRRLPTWLVDSGDLTCFGDAPSLHLARSVHREFAARATASARVVLVGNHDAWTNAPAIPNDPVQIERRESLTRDWFATQWPAPPHVAKPPTGRPVVELYGIDSSDGLDGVSLKRLAALMDQYREDDAPTVRVLASHRPMDPTPLPRVDLVLSGHTHSLSPPLGTLRSDAPAPAALGVGSLLQRGDGFAQHCAVLRFYYSASRPRVVLVERLVAARNACVGPYRFVPVDARGELAEEFVIESRPV
jgi:hypothetical protein